MIALTIVGKSFERVKNLEVGTGVCFEFELVFEDFFILEYAEPELGFLFEPRMRDEFFIVFAEVERPMVEGPMKVLFGSFVPVFFGLTLLDLFQLFDFQI